jgi:ABC-type uncharacterized transport system substrate-binding protein
VGQRRARRVGVAIHGLIASKLDLHPAQPARSYGVDLRWCYQRAAALVVKILHGTPPSNIPVEFPTSVVLSINTRTAKLLGLTVPPSLLARADEVIE